MWTAQQGGRRIVSSELTRMETLVLPIRLQNVALTADYRRLFQQRTVDLLPITSDILDRAARLRATVPGLKIPDAIHVAIALLRGCTLFVTNDTGFRRVPSLPFVILDDVLAGL
ncbi:MAG: PIN domain-containing protein [Chthonomonadaceae bacterium]|nr:PIN domain-containing protein [Chthonomonadaceae bacterium]